MKRLLTALVIIGFAVMPAAAMATPTPTAPRHSDHHQHLRQEAAAGLVWLLSVVGLLLATSGAGDERGVGRFRTSREGAPKVRL